LQVIFFNLPLQQTRFFAQPFHPSSNGHSLLIATSAGDVQLVAAATGR
jgi:hypothetical protein